VAEVEVAVPAAASQGKKKHPAAVVARLQLESTKRMQKQTHEEKQSDKKKIKSCSKSPLTS